MALLLVMLLATTTATAAVRGAGRQQQHRHHRLARVGEDEAVHFTALLRQTNLSALRDAYAARTDPDSPLWGRWLSAAEVGALTAPPEEAVRRARTWLLRGGARCTAAGPAALQCSAASWVAHRLLKTPFVRCRGAGCSHHKPTTWGMPTVPAALADVIDFIDAGQHQSALLSVPVLLAQRSPSGSHPPATTLDFGGSSSSGPSVADLMRTVVPETLRELYNATGVQGSAAVRQAAVEFPNSADDLLFDPTALAAWQKAVGVPAYTVANTSHFSQHIHAVEASLDVQQLGGIGQGNTQWYYQKPTWMLGFFAEVAAAADVPEVLSVSFGTEENTPCQHPDAPACQGLAPQQYIGRTNLELQKLGLRGVSVLVAVRHFFARRDPRLRLDRPGWDS